MELDLSSETHWTMKAEALEYKESMQIEKQNIESEHALNNNEVSIA